MVIMISRWITISLKAWLTFRAAPVVTVSLTVQVDFDLSEADLKAYQVVTPFGLTCTYQDV